MVPLLAPSAAEQLAERALGVASLSSPPASHLGAHQPIDGEDYAARVQLYNPILASEFAVIWTLIDDFHARDLNTRVIFPANASLPHIRLSADLPPVHGPSFTLVLRGDGPGELSPGFRAAPIAVHGFVLATKDGLLIFS